MAIGTIKNNDLKDIKAGDIVTHIDDIQIKTPTELSNYLRGDISSAILTLKRGSKQLNKKVTFTKYPLVKKTPAPTLAVEPLDVEDEFNN